MQLVDQ